MKTWMKFLMLAVAAIIFVQGIALAADPSASSQEDEDETAVVETVEEAATS